MPHNVAPHPEFPRIVLGDGTVVQLLVVRRRPRLVNRLCECGCSVRRWPQWWRPFRLGRTWRLTAAPEDVKLLKGYLGVAFVAMGGVSDLDAVEIRIPGIKVIRP